MINHGGGGNRAEADRWLVTAEKLLASGDFQGAKSFAIRACETDPSRAEAADDILVVCDTLIAGETRISGTGGNSSLKDWYGVLRLARMTRHSPELIAAQYRRLALLLSPTANRLPFSDQAYRIVSDAWYVLSDPSRKALYDGELQSQLGQVGFHQKTQNRNQNFGQQQFTQLHQQQQSSQQFQWQKRSKTLAEPPRSVSHQVLAEEMPNLNNATDSTRRTRLAEPSQPDQSEPTWPSGAEPTSAEPKVPSFWTSCPYCLVLYEYPKCYEECTLRCQNCWRAFQAVTVQTPPVTGKGKDVYFCSWNFFPLGFSGHCKTSGWSPVSPLFPCPTKDGEVNQNKMTSKQSTVTPRINYDEDDVYVEISGGEDEGDDGDDDWQNEKMTNKKKVKLGKGKESTMKNTKKQKLDKFEKGNQNVGSVGSVGFPDRSADQEGMVVGSSSGVAKAAGSSGRKRTGTGAKNLGRLDLNVEFNNEVEEPAVARGRIEGSGLGNRDVDNIEGIGFFEGLDEFLNSLPILSVVADDKVKAT